MNDVDLSPLNSIALCAGVGMLDEGVRLGFEHLGYAFRTVAYCEREAFGASQLVALMEAGVLDQAPIWDDLTTFIGYPWRGRVDCITAGFPCQPHSVAGKRTGLEDARWIWPDIARIVGEVRPFIVALENVPGLASTGGLGACLGDLAVLGFDAEWGLLSAADVGASHTRDRLFILAYSRREYEHLQQRGRSELEDAAWNERDRSDGESRRGRRICEAGDELGDAESFGRREGRSELRRQSRRSDPSGSGCAVADSECTERRQALESGGSCGEGSDLQGETAGRLGNGDRVLADSGCELERRHQSIAIAECDRTPNPFDIEQVVADADCARYEGGGTAMTRKDGKSRMDMLDWRAEEFSRQVRSTLDGRELSPTVRILPRRLNPAFACWLMGWPIWWTNPAVTSSAQPAMESWRSKQRALLSSLLGD